jgi:phosphohistidine swiveling domain-containing protein
MTLFDFTIDGAMVWAGMERARQQYGQPPAGTTVRRINTFYYLSQDAPPLGDDERAAMARESDARLEAAIGRYRELWEGEWLPELKAHHAWWEGFDLRGADDAALAAHARESLERMGRLWNMHFLVLSPGSAAISLVQALYLDEVGDATPLELQKLLQGFDNKTIETGRALWRLAKAAEAAPEVAAVLADTSAAEMRTRLAATAAGRSWLAQLDETLQRYGQRYENWLPSNPSWLEDPTLAIESIRGMLGRPEADPDARQAALAEERERFVAAARERLADRPAVLARFDHLLAAAQLGAVLLEDHGYWIDTRGTYKVRRVFVEIGRRLAARGLIETAEDAFHLWPEEAIGVLEGADGAGLGGLVAERKAELARFAGVRPPMELGAPAKPAAPPLDAAGRAAARVRGGGGFPNAGAGSAAEDGVLRGIAASAGVVRGTARVVRRLADATRLRPGDVLVTGSTSPAWTPLFAQVAAVVTEVGGVLGHCGIVAREYRIPAVVNVTGATTKLRDGDQVEVDGAAGTVRAL